MIIILRSGDASKKTNSDHEKGNLQLITFDRNTIHSESFGLTWTIFFGKKKGDWLYDITIWCRKTHTDAFVNSKNFRLSEADSRYALVKNLGLSHFSQLEADSRYALVF